MQRLSSVIGRRRSNEGAGQSVVGPSSLQEPGLSLVGRSARQRAPARDETGPNKGWERSWLSRASTPRRCHDQIELLNRQHWRANLKPVVGMSGYVENLSNTARRHSAPSTSWPVGFEICTQSVSARPHCHMRVHRMGSRSLSTPNRAEHPQPCPSTPNRIRTGAAAVKGRCPRPLDDGGGAVRLTANRA